MSKGTSASGSNTVFIKIQEALRGIHYPADKQTIVDTARKQGKRRCDVRARCAAGTAVSGTGRCVEGGRAGRRLKRGGAHIYARRDRNLQVAGRTATIRCHYVNLLSGSPPRWQRGYSWNPSGERAFRQVICTAPVARLVRTACGDDIRIKGRSGERSSRLSNAKHD